MFKTTSKVFFLLPLFICLACSNNFIALEQTTGEFSSASAGASIAKQHIDYVLSQNAQHKSALQNGVSAIALSDKKNSIVNGNLTIAANEVVVINSDLNVNTLTIDGALACSNQYTTNYKIQAATIYVNGILECGSAEDNRFLGRLTISLKDSAATNAARRGVIVNRAGQLRMFGADNKIGWARLSATANIGATTLQLDRPIASGWQAGDKIVLGPTGYNPYESEIFSLASVSGDGLTLRLTQATKYNHWGTIQTFQGKSGPVQLDQRAEVANLNRNIKFEADESTGTISDQNGIGGHVMVMPQGSAYIDAVEFSRMGQAGLIGRYPFHWHMTGDIYGQFIKNSSIHHTFQRCLTVHATQRALVQNNVCFDYRGHGYFLEDGDEIDNTIVGNLAVFGRRQFPDKVLIDSDRAGSFPEQRASAMSGMWISHPRNVIRDNVVSGTEGTGIWMSFITGDLPNTNGRVLNREPVTIAGQQVIPRPTKTATTDFSNNVAHTNVVGINWDGAPGGQNANNPRNPHDKLLTDAYYVPPNTPVYNNLSAFKNNLTGIYYRGSTAVFNNTMLADNNWNFFVGYNQSLTNSTIIGRSNNHDANDEKYMYVDGRSWGLRPTALILYDGPAELQNVNLLQFDPQQRIRTIHGTQYDVTSTLFYDIGGRNRYLNLFKGLYIAPQPYYKFSQGARVEAEKSNFTAAWYDVTTGAHSKDLDGSLTGRAGSVIVPKNDFVNYSGCASAAGYENFVICDGTKKVSSFYFVSNNAYQGGGGTAFLVYRNDGPSSLPVNTPNVDLDRSFDALYVGKGRGMNNKVSLLSGFEYTVVFRPVDIQNDFRKLGDRLMDFIFSAENLGELSPVLRLVGLGQQCQVAGASAVSSVDQVRSANNSAYFSSGNELWLKMRTKDRFDVITGATLSQQARINSYIRCSSPAKPQVMGNYELEVKNNKAIVSGWACDQTISDSIDLHVYVGQEMLGATRANLTSENQVLSACGNYKGHYRFTYELSVDQTNKYTGKKIDVYGLSKSGGPNLVLTQGGPLMVIPAKGQPVPPTPTQPAPAPGPAPAPNPSQPPVCQNSGSFGSGSGLTLYACECTGNMSGWTNVGGGCYHKLAAGSTPPATPAPAPAPTPANCSLSGQSIAHGASITAYLAATVASGGSCSSQTRTCNNGNLSGSYTYLSCAVSAPPAPPASSCGTPGVFEGSPGSFTQFVCDCTPQGSGWINVGGGCYHRPYPDSFFCTSANTKTYFRCNMGKPAGSGWSDVGGGCYHRGTSERCQ